MRTKNDSTTYSGNWRGNPGIVRQVVTQKKKEKSQTSNIKWVVCYAPLTSQNDPPTGFISDNYP